MPIQSTISLIPPKPAPEEASSGCTTPGRSSQLDRPDMVSPTTDGLRRRALSDWPISDVVNLREKRGHSVGSDSSANQSDGSVARKSKMAKMENYPSGVDLSLPNAVQSSSRVTIDSPQAGSEDDHQKVKKTSRNLDANEKACLLAYYGEPFYLKTEDRSKPALNYPCRFCTERGKAHPVRVSYSNLTGNLKTHRDGYTQDGRNHVGCTGRNQAKKDKTLNVPPSVAELKAKEVVEGKKITPTNDGFLTSTPSSKFSNLTFNQMTSIWLSQNALPSNTIEDHLLQGIVKYLRRDAHLYGRKWISEESDRLNFSLKEKVISDLKSLDSKITLIHDSWTTKSNRHGFIGGSVTYIDSKWQYQVRHLTLKVVEWHHHGPWLAEPMANVMIKHGLFDKLLCQTTDPGSNNLITAQEMHHQFVAQSSADYTWKPSTMQIICFCHKLACIVNSGLAELGLKEPSPLRVKTSSRGHFPVVGEEPEAELEDFGNFAPQDPRVPMAVVEEEEITHDFQELEDDDVELLGLEIGDEAECDRADEEDENIPTRVLEQDIGVTDQQDSKKLNEVLHKLDFIIRRITRSSPWRKAFDRIVKEKGLEASVGSLISGYDLLWNTKYQTRHKAWMARDVIDELCSEDLARVRSKNQTPRQNNKPHGYFHGYLIDELEWEQIRLFNDELKPFVDLNLQMEGDGPTGAMVIPRYAELRNHLESRLSQLKPTDSHYPMISKMLMQTQQYLEEALTCETLVIATILHPCFRLKFFHKFMGGKTSSHSINAAETLNRVYNDYKQRHLQANASVSALPSNEKQTEMGIFSIMYSDDEDSGELDHELSLTEYLRNNYPMKTQSYSISEPKSALKWWSDHKEKFIVLSEMARDYLAASASSCATDQTFSTVADVCSCRQGKLLPREIERLVSSRMWIREGVDLGEGFEKVTSFIKASNIKLD